MRSALAAAVALGVALRLAAALLYHPVPIGPGGDDAYYLEVAGNILHGAGFEFRGLKTAYRGPLYPLFVAGVQWAAASEGPGPVRAAQTALSIAVVLGVLLLGRSLFSEEAGLIAAACTALNAEQILLPGSLYQECFYSALLLGAAACAAWWARSPSARSAGAAGAALGASVLCRSALAPMLLAWPCLLRRRVCGSLSRAVQAAAFGAAFALLVAPWVARNRLVFDKFIPMECGVVGPILWYASMGYTYAPEDEAAVEPFRTLVRTRHHADWDAPMLRLALRNIRQRPLAYLGSTLRRLKHLWCDSYTSYLLFQHPGLRPLIVPLWETAGLLGRLAFFLLAAAAALGVWSGRRDPAVAALAAIVLCFNAYAFVTVFARFLAPAAPVLSLLAGMGAAQRLRGRMGALRSGPAA